MNRRHRPPYRVRLVFALLLFLLLVAGIASAQGGGTIGYGSVLFGRVSAELPQVLYSFNGSAHDLITVKVTGYSGGLDPRVTLLGPAQQPLLANDDAAFGNGGASYLSAFLPAAGAYSLLVEAANGQPGDFMIELQGRGPVESGVLEFGVPVRVDIPQNPQPQYYTFEADPYCPTTLTIYDVSSGQPATFPFTVKVRDEDGLEVGMIRGGRVLENRLTVAPDGDPNPGTEMYEVEVDSADPLLQGSLVLVITCASDVPACLGPDSVGTIATAVPTIDPNGTPTLTWTPPPGDDPCLDPMASATPSISLIPVDPVVEIAGSDETPEATEDLSGVHSAAVPFDVPTEVTGEAPAEATENPEHSAVVPDGFLTQQAMTEEPLEPILPDPPSIALEPSATPTAAINPTPCPTWTPPPPDEPCVEPTAVVLELPNTDTTVSLPTEEAQPLTFAAAPPTFTPTPLPQGTPCPTVTPTATPTYMPSLTPTNPPPTRLDCSAFALTSPTDGLPNGGVTVYWDPVTGATSYRVNVYGEGGAPLLLSVEVAAPATNVGIDVSEGSIGPGFVFVLQVQALFDGQVHCTDAITLMRESPGGGDPNDEPDDDPRDEPEEEPTFCPPTIACN